MNLINTALEDNVTFQRPAQFYILGFSGIPNLTYYFVFLFVIYIVSVLGNTLVMTAIYVESSLRTPKYLIFFNLAFVDLCRISILAILLLDTYLINNQFISYNKCMTNMLCTYVTLAMQSFNLTMLAYDRLAAISFPLRYHTLVTSKTMSAFTGAVWLVSILFNLINAGAITRMTFCRSLVIQSYVCDHGSLFRLACNSNSYYLTLRLITPVIIVWLPFGFIIVTYVSIGVALRRVSTNQGRLKAVRTCTTHLMLVALFYLPLTMTFFLGEGVSINTKCFYLSLTTALPPMLNPIIYVLKTEEFKVSAMKLVKTSSSFLKF
ncbi:olfactory receptor 8-like [Hypomesus transpacificus]|uniref:olfactory receptor 8-like n=1 Tax=Hypomesus transpacificus TaxID=137520 RepID=UPI001F0730C2|nr:olfactory receptor 8-like [Hypomesus transpacificus]